MHFETTAWESQECAGLTGEAGVHRGSLPRREHTGVTKDMGGHGGH